MLKKPFVSLEKECNHVIMSAMSSRNGKKRKEYFLKVQWKQTWKFVQIKENLLKITFEWRRCDALENLKCQPGVPGWRGRFRPLNIFVEDIFGKDSKQSLKNVPKSCILIPLNPWGWLAANISLKYHCWMKHYAHVSSRNDTWKSLWFLTTLSLSVPHKCIKNSMDNINADIRV